ncbi:MAG: enoyl-CoA hydratase/isomerase family protein [Betaproteobacteria bacterium]|nr:enoyl-CoA hydratase/isomerase family protein [Betaproteobacteria bacterium]
MGEYQSIKMDTDDDGVTLITLNRPDRLNAFNRQMIAEWTEALQLADADPATRVVLITGAGRAFCAGGDAGEMEELAVSDNVSRKDYLWRGVHRIPMAMARMEKPVIAVLNGTARGAGLDMALFCDMRLAAESATFAESYIHMGVMSGDGGTYLLPRLIGVANSFDLLWTGRLIDAQEALRMGLVNRVVPDAELFAQARELARSIARQPQQAIRLTKRALYQSLDTSLETHLDMVSSHMAVLYDTDDFREKLKAFRSRSR